MKMYVTDLNGLQIEVTELKAAIDIAAVYKGFFFFF